MELETKEKKVAHQTQTWEILRSDFQVKWTYFRCFAFYFFSLRFFFFVFISPHFHWQKSQLILNQEKQKQSFNLFFYIPFGAVRVYCSVCVYNTKIETTWIAYDFLLVVVCLLSWFFQFSIFSNLFVREKEWKSRDNFRHWMTC